MRIAIVVGMRHILADGNVYQRDGRTRIGVAGCTHLEITRSKHIGTVNIAANGSGQFSYYAARC